MQRRVGNLRWGIAILLGAGIVVELISYILLFVTQRKGCETLQFCLTTFERQRGCIIPLDGSLV